MTLYDIDVTAMDGTTRPLDVYRGQTLLVVNVASLCRYTPQYAGLEALYRKYQDRGFVVLGFPCDQFGHQEPCAEAEIQAFCSRTYGVTFPLFRKIRVNGDSAHPLFKFLKSQKTGVLGWDAIKWNFTKFLVNRNGIVFKRYGPAATPGRIERDVATLVAAT